MYGAARVNGPRKCNKFNNKLYCHAEMRLFRRHIDTRTLYRRKRAIYCSLLSTVQFALSMEYMIGDRRWDDFFNGIASSQRGNNCRSIIFKLSYIFQLIKTTKASVMRLRVLK